MRLFSLKLNKIRFLKESVFLILLILAIVFSFNLLFYSPAKKEIKDLQAGIGKLNGLIANYQEVASNSRRDSKKLQELVKAYEDMTARLLFSKEQIPPSKEVSNILKELSSPRPGLILVSVKASALEDKGEYLRLPLVMQVRGDFPSIGAYLVSLENSRRLITMENISMVKEGKAGLSINLELSAYLMKEGTV